MTVGTVRLPIDDDADEEEDVVDLHTRDDEHRRAMTTADSFLISEQPASVCARSAAAVAFDLLHNGAAVHLI